MIKILLGNCVGIYLFIYIRIEYECLFNVLSEKKRNFFVLYVEYLQGYAYVLSLTKVLCLDLIF